METRRSARPADIFREERGRVGPGSHYSKRGGDGLGIYVLGERRPEQGTWIVRSLSCRCAGQAHLVGCALSKPDPVADSMRGGRSRQRKNPDLQNLDSWAQNPVSGGIVTPNSVPVRYASRLYFQGVPLG